MADVKYELRPNGDLELTDYNRAKLCCSFLPGIAGKNAIPSWAFYINRGQCLAGFGIRDKDGAIQEYVPADKAGWYTAWRGFDPKRPNRRCSGFTPANTGTWNGIIMTFS